VDFFAIVLFHKSFETLVFSRHLRCLFTGFKFKIKK
jgi:hypothetical protein